jgi:hypothetical protein
LEKMVFLIALRRFVRWETRTVTPFAKDVNEGWISMKIYQTRCGTAA